MVIGSPPAEHAGVLVRPIGLVRVADVNQGAHCIPLVRIRKAFRKDIGAHRVSGLLDQGELRFAKSLT